MLHIVENIDLIDEVFNYSHILVGTSIMNTLYTHMAYHMSIKMENSMNSMMLI